MKDRTKTGNRCNKSNFFATNLTWVSIILNSSMRHELIFLQIRAPFELIFRIFLNLVTKIVSNQEMRLSRTRLPFLLKVDIILFCITDKQPHVPWTQSCWRTVYFKRHSFVFNLKNHQTVMLRVVTHIWKVPPAFIGQRKSSLCSRKVRFWNH